MLLRAGRSRPVVETVSPALAAAAAAAGHQVPGAEPASGDSSARDSTPIASGIAILTRAYDVDGIGVSAIVYDLTAAAVRRNRACPRIREPIFIACVCAGRTTTAAC